MTVKDQLLPVIDDVRQLIEDLGFRITTVTLRTKTWSSGQTGRGTPTTVDVPITPKPKLKNLGGGAFSITGITPPYTGGGWSVDALVPDQASGSETFIVLESVDGFQRECRIVDIDRKSLTYSLLVQDRK